MVNLAAYKEIYNWEFSASVVLLETVPGLTKRNFCGKCLSFMFLADLQVFLWHRCSSDCSLYKHRQKLCQNTGYGMCQVAD